MLRKLGARLFLRIAGSWLVCLGLGIALMGIAFLDQWPALICLGMLIGGGMVFFVGRNWERTAEANRLLRQAERR